MPEFKSWRGYWEFEQTTKRRTRYVYDQEVKAFLDTVGQTSEKRTEVLPAENFLWRAQLGNAWEPISEDGEYIDDFPIPHPPQRMKPLVGRATEGRANPKGIPYLYLATHRDTALAEVRPWIGLLISVGQFKTLRAVRIVNCTTDRKGHRIYAGEPSPEKREEAVWADIDQAFARPVSPCDDIADYVPTQIIAEFFKAAGFDGVAYRSSLGTGHNVALFDPDLAEIINCFLFEAKSIEFEFEEAANPYFIQKDYDKNSKAS